MEYNNCKVGPYYFSPGDIRNTCDNFHFWSLHYGGANFLFVDGSVRFLNYNIGKNLVQLATRAGGEELNFDY